MEPSLLQNLLVAHLVKKLPACYRTRKLIIIFTTESHWLLSWARWVQSTYSPSISFRSSLILSSHVLLGLPSGPFRSDFPTKVFSCISHLSHACYISCPFHPPWFYQPNNKLWSVKVMKLFNMWHFLTCHILIIHMTNPESRDSSVGIAIRLRAEGSRF
jgi:hypothetical protein